MVLASSAALLSSLRERGARRVEAPHEERRALDGVPVADLLGVVERVRCEAPQLEQLGRRLSDQPLGLCDVKLRVPSLHRVLIPCTLAGMKGQSPRTASGLHSFVEHWVELARSGAWALNPVSVVFGTRDPKTGDPLKDDGVLVLHNTANDLNGLIRGGVAAAERTEAYGVLMAFVGLVGDEHGNVDMEHARAALIFVCDHAKLGRLWWHAPLTPGDGSAPSLGALERGLPDVEVRDQTGTATMSLLPRAREVLH